MFRSRAGVIAAVVLLVLMVPTVAFAYSATFSYQTPEPGSGTTDTTPKLSVVVYDKYGVYGSTKYNMWVDGVRVAKESLTLSRYSGWGYRKFKLAYQVPAALAFGDHRVTVIVKDLRGITSSTSWHYNVVDGVAPVTTSDAVLNYTTGSAHIHLFASDNVAVAHTYYRLDGGEQVSGTQVTVTGSASLPLHSLEFWSVDTAGNVEASHKVVFFVPAPVEPAVVTHSLPTGANAACFVSGCHDDSQNNVARIHRNAVNDSGAYRGCLCHQRATLSKDCIGCHTATPDMHSPGTHPAITSSGDPSCSQATCHGTAVITIHGGDCALCHDSSDEAVQAAIESGDAHCESCHAGAFDTIHAGANGVHSVSGACFNANCHPSDARNIHTDWADPPGCAACHAPGVTPSLVCATCHPNIGTVHEFNHVDASGTKSTACTECHGTDLPTVHGNVGCVCHTALYLVAEMGPLMQAGTAECVDCHKDMYAAHGFDMTASGHNTTTYGTIGAKTKFDGSQGILLTDNFGDTVTTTWEFPEVNVFWSADAIVTGEAPSTAIVGLDKDSVVTCQDCHTGLLADGPHGAAQNFGIDPNYPGDYKYAVLGARKGTTEDTSTSGIKYDMTQELYGPVPGRLLTIDGALYGPLPLLQTYRNQGNFPAYIADGTKGEHAVICAKCHDLYNAGTGCDGWSNAYSEQATSGAEPLLDEASPESVHGMHAGGITNDTPTRLDQRGGNQGRTDGRGDCVNCHIAIPHGWKRPRLLVNGYSGTYMTGQTWNPTGGSRGTGAYEGGVPTLSIADAFPYWQGRGQYISEGNSPGNGPIDASENHLFNEVQGVPVWSEQACISCSDGAFWESGGLEENGLEHSGWGDSAHKLQ